MSYTPRLARSGSSNSYFEPLEAKAKGRYCEKLSCVGLSIQDDPYLPKSVSASGVAVRVDSGSEGRVVGILGQVHHAINEYQLRLDVKRFLWPVYYIVILYYAGPLISCILGCNHACFNFSRLHSGSPTLHDSPYASRLALFPRSPR